MLREDKLVIGSLSASKWSQDQVEWLKLSRASDAVQSEAQGVPIHNIKTRLACHISEGDLATYRWYRFFGLNPT